MLLNDAKGYYINGSKVKEMWFGGNRVWSGANHTLLSYIETNSTTKGIDTGFIPSKYTKIEYNVAQIDISSNNHNNGFELFSAGWDVYCAILWNDNTKEYGFNFTHFGGVIEYVLDCKMYRNTQYKIVLDQGNLYFKDEFKKYSKQTYDGTTNTLKLGYRDGSKYFVSQRIYGCKIWDNDILVRDLIPVLNDGVPCMYDKVKGEYHYAQSGTFSYGTL